LGALKCQYVSGEFGEKLYGMVNEYQTQLNKIDKLHSAQMRAIATPAYANPWWCWQ